MSSTRFLKILSSFLVLLYFSTMVVVADAHDHWTFVEKGAPSLRVHECGAKEMHKNIDMRHHCLVCFRLSNSTADVQCSLFAPDLRIEFCAHSLSVTHFNCFNSNFAPKRGPPPFHASV